MWIKVCGCVDVANAIAVAECGVDAIGLNFYPKSKRFVAADSAAEISSALLGQFGDRVDRVGLFVNAAVEQIAATVQDVGLTHVQLHGDESPAFATDLATQLCSDAIRIIRAVRAATVEEARDEIAAFQAAGCSHVLLDAYADDAYGGTGHRIDWGKFTKSALVAPGDRSPHLTLAGGLVPENVAEAVAVVRPDGVDVASGVEEQPGWKSIEKVRDFVAAARGA